MLVTAKNIYEWGKEGKTVRPHTLSTLEEPDTNTSNKHDITQQHHDEDPVLVVEFLYRDLRMWATWDELHAHYTLCNLLYARTNGPLTPPSAHRFNIRFERLMKQVRFCRSFRLPTYCLLTVFLETSLRQ